MVALGDEAGEHVTAAQVWDSYCSAFNLPKVHQYLHKFYWDPRWDAATLIVQAVYARAHAAPLAVGVPVPLAALTAAQPNATHPGGPPREAIDLSWDRSAKKFALRMDEPDAEPQGWLRRLARPLTNLVWSVTNWFAPPYYQQALVDKASLQLDQPAIAGLSDSAHAHSHVEIHQSVFASSAAGFTLTKSKLLGLSLAAVALALLVLCCQQSDASQQGSRYLPRPRRRRRQSTKDSPARPAQPRRDTALVALGAAPPPDEAAEEGIVRRAGEHRVAHAAQDVVSTGTTTAVSGGATTVAVRGGDGGRRERRGSSRLVGAEGHGAEEEEGGAQLSRRNAAVDCVAVNG
eukprot:Selendium_serpulae@DN3841_c0_g1_i2.p1